MRTYLAITPKALSQLPAPPPLPLVHMAYAVGQGGCLTRCAAANLPHGGLMGLSDRCSGSIPRADALCRAIDDHALDGIKLHPNNSALALDSDYNLSLIHI